MIIIKINKKTFIYIYRLRSPSSSIDILPEIINIELVLRTKNIQIDDDTISQQIEFQF